MLPWSGVVWVCSARQQVFLRAQILGLENKKAGNSSPLGYCVHVFLQSTFSSVANLGNVALLL